MKKSEVALLLTMTKAFDDRVSVDEARVEAWHAALHPSMDFDTAKQLVINHYAERTNALMPAHLNEAWRAVRRREIERQQADERAIAAAAVNPPTEEFLRLMRSQMNTLFTDAAIPQDILDELNANPCPTCHATSEQPCNDDKPHPARWDVAREKVKTK